MARHRRFLLAGCVVGMLSAALLWSPGGAAHQPDKDFKADEEIQALAVKIDIGAGGADLEEPVALDLGLGFPFWLHPVGRQPKEVPPFGAVPQETTAQAKVAAGTSVTFTFSIQEEAGQDQFRTTSQLLAGVRVSDISRIGFASEGKTNWTLAGYEIRINNKVFASGTPKEGAGAPDTNKQKLDELDKKIVPLQSELADLQALAQAKLASPDDLKRLADVEASLKALLDERSKLLGKGGAGLQAKAAQDAARARLAELETKMAPLVSQWSEARTLAETQLAEDADRQRLAELQNSLEPLVREKAWLEGQLQGRYPWFEDKEFKSPWRADTPVRSARVTLVTATHPGADTHNYVFFHTGGHKYLLASPERPLTAGALQAFQLDLLAGPLLTPADLRGWGVGMLAPAQPFGAAPDRWHPQRILVEIDGKIVYDSDEMPLDQKSLEAIRIIPPAHEGKDGNVVVNAPIARETTDWTAGKGAGLDPQTGQALSLPATNDPTYPQAEPGLPGPPPVTEPLTGEEPPCFPGEYPPPPPPGLDPNEPPPEPPIPLPGPGGGNINIFIGGGGGGLTDGGVPGWFADWLANLLQQVTGGGGTMPAGDPVQVDNVRITNDACRADDWFTVEWTVSGDESTVDHYVVQLWQVDVEHPGNLYPVRYDVQPNVPRGQHIATATIPALIAAAQPYGVFVAPNVVAVPVDPALPTSIPGKTGPARVVCPAGTDQAFQAIPGPNYIYNGELPPGTLISVTGPVPPGQHGVWTEGLANSYLAVDFESRNTGWNLAVRPQAATDTMELYFLPSAPKNLPGPPPPKFRLVAYLGFLGGAGANNQVDVDVTGIIAGYGPPFGLNTYPLVPYPVQTPQGGANAGMVRIDQLLDTNDAILAGGANPWGIGVVLNFKNFGTDDGHPPALFGIRLIPQP